MKIQSNITECFFFQTTVHFSVLLVLLLSKVLRTLPSFASVVEGRLTRKASLTKLKLKTSPRRAQPRLKMDPPMYYWPWSPLLEFEPCQLHPNLSFPKIALLPSRAPRTGGGYLVPPRGSSGFRFLCSAECRSPLPKAAASSLPPSLSLFSRVSFFFPSQSVTRLDI